DISNFDWSISGSSAKVKNGEVVAVAQGRSLLTVRGGLDANGRTVTKSVWIDVADSDKKLEISSPTAKFSTVVNDDESLDAAQGIVQVSSGQEFKLTPVIEPWYYPTNNLVWTWESGNESYATVDSNGNVKVLYEGEYSEDVKISATAKNEAGAELFTAEVLLSVQPSFTVNGTALRKYRGMGGELKESITVGGQTFHNVRVLEFPKDRTINQIGDEAFRNVKNVEVIIIPKHVTTIGERAFEGCENLKAICFVQLEEQEIADSSLTLISKNAFSGCNKLEVVDLTNCKIFTVDRNAFAGCTALKKVVKMTAIGTVYSGAFSGCTSLESADISNLHVAGASVFDGCTSLSQITTSYYSAIGTYMFRGCTSLREVEIACPVIGAGAFAGCVNLEKVDYTYTGASALTIGASAFENCSSLTAFNVNGQPVGSIGDYAFRRCSVLASLGSALTDGNTVLGNDAFDGVPSMGGDSVIRNKTLVLAPATVDSVFAAKIASGDIEAISPNAFSSSRMASGVTELDLSNVKSIGTGAFRGLTGLRKVTLNTGLTEISAYAFSECTDLTEIEIPVSVTKIGDYAFYGCTSLATVNFTDLVNLTEIGAGAFGGVAIATLNLPDGLQKVGNEAFARCGNLTEVTVNSVDDNGMGNRVFALCGKLATVTFGENAQSTGNYTFSTVGYGYNAEAEDFIVTEFVPSALTSVVFGSKIEKIGNGVFACAHSFVKDAKTGNFVATTYAGCDKLTQINLNNVKSVGDNAFEGCTALAALTGIDKVTLIGSYAFSDCTALTSLDLSSAKEIHACAFQMASGVTSVTFGNGLEGIGDYAFYGTALTNVTVPAACAYVGSAAFARCASLTSIKVAEGNEKYFDDNGVLYRYIDKAKGVYELTQYPAGKGAFTDEENVRTYTVKEGTVSLLAYSFNGVPSSSINKVVLPYSLKLIGHGAFFDSTIGVYRFESIQAPSLLQGVMDRPLSNSYSSNSFFNINFGSMVFDSNGNLAGTYLTSHTVKYPSDTPTDNTYTMKLQYPSNGTGYDNYIYNGYFGTNRESIGELPESTTRELLDIITNLAYDAETVKGWNKGNVATDVVADFAEIIKRAHGLYNDLRTENQINYVGQENIDKLFAVESALKQVKPLFGLQPAISTVVVDSSSTHRTAYTAGERFLLDGIKLLVTYDDFSTEVIDVSGNFKLRDSLNRALRVTDRIMTLEGLGDFAGKSVRISITVAEGTGVTPQTPVTNSGSNNKLSAGVIAAIVIGVAVIIAAAAVAVVIVLKKRKAVAADGDNSVYVPDDEAEGEISTADGETESGDAEKHSEDNNQQENSGEEKTDD
ncbi:MAG: leucine-rich repeat protein, partial [Clostridia bacterium]|nr:leucine-rich repeat protein [Clostridia bacterium]